MPVTPEAVERKACEAIAAELCCPLDLVTPDSTLAVLPGLDSVKLLRVITTLEEAFDIVLDDELLYDLVTVSDLAKVVASELPPGTPSMTRTTTRERGA